MLDGTVGVPVHADGFSDADPGWLPLCSPPSLHLLFSFTFSLLLAGGSQERGFGILCQVKCPPPTPTVRRGKWLFFSLYATVGELTQLNVWV